MHACVLDILPNCNSEAFCLNQACWCILDFSLSHPERRVTSNKNVFLDGKIVALVLNYMLDSLLERTYKQPTLLWPPQYELRLVWGKGSQR